MKKILSLVTLVGLLWLTIVLTGCGGSSGDNIQPPPTITGVTVSPTSATLNSGASQQFSATVSGTGNYDSTVFWNICDSAGSNCVKGGNSTYGTVSSGLYTAPTLTPGGSALKVSVKATANGDSTKSASAAVTVNAPPVTTGTLIWEKTQTIGTHGNALYSLAVDVNANDVVAVGSKINSTNTGTVGYGTAYDLDGNNLWTADFMGDTASDFEAVYPNSPSLFMGEVGEPNETVTLIGVGDQGGQVAPNNQCGPGVITVYAQLNNTLYLGVTNKTGSAPSAPYILLSDTTGALNCGQTPIQVFNGVTPFVSNNANLTSMALTPNNHLVIAGFETSDSTGATNSGSWLVDMDDAGNIFWSRLDDTELDDVLSPGVAIQVENGKTYIYVGGTSFKTGTSLELFVTKIDESTGQTVSGWPKMSTVMVQAGGHGTVANPAAIGGVIVAGSAMQAGTTDPNQSDAFLAAFDANGNLAWTTRVNVPGSISAFVAAQVVGYNLYACGITNAGSPTQAGLITKFVLPH